MPGADGISPLIPLDRAAARRLRQQIGDALRHAIAPGQVRAGQRLPYSRELASALAVSRMPVTTAYMSTGRSTARAEGVLEEKGTNGLCVYLPG